MSDNSNDQPFKCIECEKVVTTDGDWPEACPHCGSKEWMTTMHAKEDPKDLKEADVPDPDND